VKALLVRLDRLQRRHRWTALPIAVYTRFNEHQGARLAANASYFAFFSIFPLMLAFTTILGLVLEDNPELLADIKDSVISNIPVIGSQIGSTDALTGNIVALVVGIVLAIVGGLRLIDSLQYALNELWDVPLHARPGGLSSRIRGVLVLAVFGGGIIGSTVLASLPAALDLGLVGPLVGIVASVFANIVAIVGVQMLLLTHRPTLHELLPGSILAGVVIHVLQQLGVVLAQQLSGSSDTYGALAAIIGLLAFFHLVFRVLLLSLEVNAVRARDLVPRSILKDDEELTDGDRRALLLDVQRVQRNPRVGYAIAIGGLVASDDDAAR